MSLTHLRSPLGNCGTQKFTNDTGAAIPSGAIHNAGDLYGPVLETTADGAEGVIIYRTDSQGYNSAKAAVAVTEGETAYLIIATGLVTNADGGGANPQIGHFAESAGAGVARVRTVWAQS